MEPFAGSICFAPVMRKNSLTHRTAIVALSASLAFPIAPVSGQAAPVVVAPPSPVSVAPPPPVTVAPPPPAAVSPPPAARPVPAARAAPSEAAPAARETRSTPRTARAAPRARAAAPETAASAPVATPAPAPVAEAPLPAETAPLASPPPVPSEAPAETTGTAEPGGSSLPWLIAGLALLAGLAAFALLRRRRHRDDVYEDHAYEQPAYVEERVVPHEPDYQPAMVAPLPSFRREQPTVAAESGETIIESDVEAVNEVETSAADIAVLGAADTTHRNRPWLEMLMRPIRAGANGEDTVVEFSLTVGNTGGVPAENVRISAWMLAGQGSEMEGLLIDPPAGATLSETRIEAGDGATVEATVTMPREAFDRAMLPVVVTDARYRLADGREGRTSASFAVGLPAGEELVPFPANAASGLNEGVEARVHGEVEHV